MFGALRAWREGVTEPPPQPEPQPEPELWLTVPRHPSGNAFGGAAGIAVMRSSSKEEAIALATSGRHSLAAYYTVHQAVLVCKVRVKPEVEEIE